MTIVRARSGAAPSRRPGTSRCGSTEVYQEPGPSTTQSAASIAATASGHAGGSGGLQPDLRDRSAGGHRDLASAR